MTDNVYCSATEVLRRMRVDERFIATLLQADDWSFVIKSHALAEAALTHAIVNAIDSGAIASFVDELRMSQRIRLADVLGLLSNESLNGVRLLSRLRNTLAHDVASVNFQFEDYLTNNDRRNEFFSTYAQVEPGTMEIEGMRVDRKQFLKENPKLAITLCLVSLLADVDLAEARADLKRTHGMIAEEFLANFAKHAKSDRPAASS